METNPRQLVKEETEHKKQCGSRSGSALIFLFCFVFHFNWNKPPSCRTKIGEREDWTQKAVRIQIGLRVDFSVLSCLSLQLKQTPIMQNQDWWKRRLNTKNSADPDRAPRWFFCFVLSFISTETNPHHAEPRLVKEKTEHKKQCGSRSGSTLIFLFCFVFHFNWKLECWGNIQHDEGAGIPDPDFNFHT